MTPVLTIAIPTFDRPDRLHEAVAAFVPQLTPAVRLLVFDNASPKPAADALADLLVGLPLGQATVVRNAVNVGANANVARCYERCETDWVWVCGDDDVPRSGAVATVLADIAAHPAAVFLHYSSDFHTRTAEYITRGLDEFVDRLDSLAGLTFISAGVLRVAACREAIRPAYQFLYANNTQTVLLFCSLGDTGECRFRPAQLVDADTSGYSRLTVALGFPILLDLPVLADRHRRRLGPQLRTTFCSFDRLVSQLVFETARHGDVGSSVYYFDQLYARLYQFEPNPVARLKARLARPLVRFPRLGRRLLRAALRVRYPAAEVDRIEADRGGTARLERL